MSLVFPRGIHNIWRKEMVCRLQISVKFPAVRVWVRASGLLGFQLTLMREVRNEVSKALHSGCRRLLTAFDEVSSNFELILSIPLLYRTLAFGDIFISLIRKPCEIFRTNKDSYGLW